MDARRLLIAAQNCELSAALNHESKVEGAAAAHPRGEQRVRTGCEADEPRQQRLLRRALRQSRRRQYVTVDIVGSVQCASPSGRWRNGDRRARVRNKRHLFAVQLQEHVHQVRRRDIFRIVSKLCQCICQQTRTWTWSSSTAS